MQSNSQLSFDGFALQPATDRLFFALFPDAETAGRIAGLAKELREKNRLGGKPLETERFHVTLFHLGDYAGLPKDIAAKAMDAGARVKAAPFTAVFDRAESFKKPSKSPFVLREAEGSPIETLRQALGFAMAGAGLQKLVNPYTPHITLLYDDQMIESQPIAPIAWRAREVVLIHSLLGKTTHIPLGRWQLG